MVRMLKIVAFLFFCAVDGYSQWIGAWDVASGRMVASTGIDVRSSSEDVFWFDRNPTNGQVLCASSNGLWTIDSPSHFELVQRYLNESEFIMPHQSRFIPSMDAVISIGYREKADGSALLANGIVNVIKFNNEHSLKSFDLGPVDYKLAILRNGDIVEANKSFIKLRRRIGDSEWGAASEFEHSDGKITEMKDLGGDSLIAVWTASTFSVVNVLTKSVDLKVVKPAKVYDSWAATPVLSPDSSQIIVNERRANGSFVLSVYSLKTKSNMPVSQIELGDKWLSGMAFSPSGKHLAIAFGEDTQVVIYTSATWAIYKKLKVPKKHTDDNSQHPQIIYSADGKRIYVYFINPGC